MYMRLYTMQNDPLVFIIVPLFDVFQIPRMYFYTDHKWNIRLPIIIAMRTHYVHNTTSPQKYRETSSIRRTKSHNFNVSRLLLQLSLLNLLNPAAKSRMKMKSALVQLHLSDQ